MYDLEQSEIAISGQKLSASKAEALEKNLLRKPTNVRARLKLLGFHENQVSIAKFRHVIWLISNFPAYELNLRDLMHLDNYPHRLWEEGSKCWDRQVRLFETNPVVLFNAASYLASRDFSRAEALFGNAQILDPANAWYPYELSRYALYRMKETKGDDASKLANKVIDAGKIVIRVGLPIPQLAGPLYMRMAEAALMLEDLSQAAEYAQKAADTQFAWGVERDFRHVICGMVALRRGDVPLAKQHLNSTTLVRGVPLVFELAIKLLETDDADGCVAGFLSNYLRIVISPGEELGWIEDIYGGLNP